MPHMTVTRYLAASAAIDRYQRLSAIESHDAPARDVRTRERVRAARPFKVHELARGTAHPIARDPVSHLPVTR